MDEGRKRVLLIAASILAARKLAGGQEIYYPGRPHGLTATHQDEVNADLLKFLKSVQQAHKTAA